MSYRLDTHVTGPIPKPGTRMIELYSKTREEASRFSPGTSKFESINQDVLLSTSKFFQHKLHSRHHYITIVWKEPLVVEAYVKWLHDRIIHRIPVDGRATYTIAHSLLKYPSHPLKEYAPVVHDIHALVNMWLFGWSIQDATFMDTVLDTLKRLLDEAHHHNWDYNDGNSAPQTFIKFMVPAVIEAIWTNTTPSAKLRSFVVDTILKYGSNADIIGFNATKIEFKATKTERKDSPVKAAPCSALSIRGKATRSTARLTRSTTPQTAVSVSDASEEGKEPTCVNVYPVEFVEELNRVHWDTLLVSQLPTDVQDFFYDHVRVFLLPPPYSPEMVISYGSWLLKVAKVAMSIREMNPMELEAFLGAVDGKVNAIYRSAYHEPEAEVQSLDGSNIADVSSSSKGLPLRLGSVAVATPYGEDKLFDADDDGDVEMGDAEETSDAEPHQVMTSCVYHEHTDDAACYLLGQRFHRGAPVAE